MRLARGKKMNKEFDQIVDNFLEPIKIFKGNLSDLLTPPRTNNLTAA